VSLRQGVIMAKKKERLILLLVLGGTLGGLLLYSLSRHQPKDALGYPEPRYPAYVLEFEELDDEELMMLARRAARRTRGHTRLGLVEPGGKALIWIEAGQDMRVLKAILAALEERGVEADYKDGDELVAEVLGITKEEVRRQIRAGSVYGHGVGIQGDGSKEGYRWPKFLPEEVVKQANERLIRAGELQGEGSRKQVEAVKKYLEAHPEYTNFFGAYSGYFMRYAQTIIGDKYTSYWRYRSSGDLRKQKLPDDVLRMVEDKVLEVLPWIEEVRFTAPEGTNVGFSITAEEAELWSKGAYEVTWIKMSPLGATHQIYYFEGIKKLVAPKIRGVIAATGGHSGWFPRMKVYLEGGQVQRVEGGGRYGELFRMYLENEKLKKAHYPHMPEPGFFYVYEWDLGTDPKSVSGGLGFPPGMQIGFGVDSEIPEMHEYAEKHNLPLGHGMHVHIQFPTYEVKTRGTPRWIKISEPGHRPCRGSCG